MTVKHNQPFRRWLQRQWFDHCAEFESWHNHRPDYTVQDYFNRYKYWLRREYRHQQQGTKHGS